MPVVPDLAGISRIDLTVTDVNRSERFYTEVLGFRVVDRVEKEGFRSTVMRHQGLPHELCVEWPAANDGSCFDEFRMGLDHLSFGVRNRAELERWQEHLGRHGVTYTPIADAPYGAVLVFRDPNNIQLELMADLESST